MYFVRRGKWSNLLSHYEYKIFSKFFTIWNAINQCDKCIYSLSFNLIAHTNNSGFSTLRMRN
nr:hypothetical protein Iba_chr07eCG11680 [Ipomoea batatas]